MYLRGKSHAKTILDYAYSKIYLALNLDKNEFIILRFY